MDPVANPYAPGAGTPPPELAGRAASANAFDRNAHRFAEFIRSSNTVLPTRRSPTIKTLLAGRMREDAEATQIHTVGVEAREGRSLPALLAPQLRQALLRLCRNERAKALAQRGLRALAGFAKALKVKYGDIEVGLDLDPEAGLADNGDLEQDLPALLEA
jgi:hypothetical protein